MTGAVLIAGTEHLGAHCLCFRWKLDNQLVIPLQEFAHPRLCSSSVINRVLEYLEVNAKRSGVTCKGKVGVHDDHALLGGPLEIAKAISERIPVLAIITRKIGELVIVSVKF